MDLKKALGYCGCVRLGKIYNEESCAVFSVEIRLGTPQSQLLSKILALRL